MSSVKHYLYRLWVIELSPLSEFSQIPLRSALSAHQSSTLLICPQVVRSTAWMVVRGATGSPPKGPHRHWAGPWLLGGPVLSPPPKHLLQLRCSNVDPQLRLQKSYQFQMPEKPKTSPLYLS